MPCSMNIKILPVSNSPMPVLQALLDTLRDTPYDSHCIEQPRPPCDNENNTFNIKGKGKICITFLV